MAWYDSDPKYGYIYGPGDLIGDAHDSVKADLAELGAGIKPLAQQAALSAGVGGLGIALLFGTLFLGTGYLLSDGKNVGKLIGLGDVGGGFNKALRGLK